MIKYRLSDGTEISVAPEHEKIFLIQHPGAKKIEPGKTLDPATTVDPSAGSNAMGSNLEDGSSEQQIDNSDAILQSLESIYNVGTPQMKLGASLTQSAYGFFSGLFSDDEEVEEKDRETESYRKIANTFGDNVKKIKKSTVV
mgnify:CR=1 FL=1